MIKTTKTRPDASTFTLELSFSNSKSWKSGSNPIRSDYKTTLSDPIRSEMILLDPKSEKIRSDRIGFGLVSDRICTSLHQIERILASSGIKVYHCSNKKIYQLLYTHKDKTDINLKPGVYI